MQQNPKGRPPLSGLRVIELADEKIQYCGKLFADLGAEVIKIERPGGDPTRHIGPFYEDIPDPERSISFWFYNTCKRSVTLDIEKPDGARLFEVLVERADVLLESTPPEYLASLGLHYDALRERNPRLIMTAVTPFGQSGPWRDLFTSDLVSLALGGPIASCGYDDQDVPPVRGGGNQGWNTGGHYGFISTMVALLYRGVSGRGQYIDVSIHEALSATTEGAAVYGMYEQTLLIRQTGRHAATQQTPNSQVQCADGGYVAGVGWLNVNDAAWGRLVAWLDSEGLAMDLTDPRYLDGNVRTQDANHITEVIHAFCLTHTSEEIFRGAQAVGLNWGRVRAPHELVSDPHCTERGFIVDVLHEDLGRTFRYPGAPYIFSESPWDGRHRAPHVGEHNVEVFCDELGLSRAQLIQLVEAGIV